MEKDGTHDEWGEDNGDMEKYGIYYEWGKDNADMEEYANVDSVEDIMALNMKEF